MLNLKVKSGNTIHAQVLQASDAAPLYFPSTVLQLKWRWIDKSRFRILSLGCFGPRAVMREDLHGVDAAGDEAAAEPTPDQLGIH